VTVGVGLVLAAFAAQRVSFGASWPGPTLEINVIQASATDAGGSVDPTLGALLTPSLVKQQPFVRYNIFKSLAHSQLSLASRKPVSFPLPNGQTLQASLDGVPEAGAKYQLSTRIVAAGDAGPGTFVSVTASANTAFFVGGPGYQGGTLFLALTVHP
jgi:hypothetical protein